MTLIKLNLWWYDFNSSYLFLINFVQWKNRQELVLVPSKELNLSHPQEVIKYYQAHIIFHDDNEAHINEE